MVWVAIAEAAALVMVVSVLLRALAGQQRQHARREDLLIAQLLHAAGKAWTPAPADELERERVELARRDRTRFRAAPEQYPTD